MRSSLGLGRIATGLQDFFVGPPSAWSGGVVRGLIICHDQGETAATAVSYRLTRTGSDSSGMFDSHACGCLSMGDNWGNDASIAQMEAIRLWLVSRGAADTGVAMLGLGMGALAVLGYARAHPEHVYMAALVTPILDLNDVYTNNRGGNAAAINTAYGGTYSPSSHGPTHSPLAYASQLELPIYVYYGLTDAVALPASAVAFGAACPSATIESLGGGHAADPGPIPIFNQLKRPSTPFNLRSLTVTAPSNELSMSVAWTLPVGGPPATTLRLEFYQRVNGVGTKFATANLYRPDIFQQPYRLPLGVAGTFYVIATPSNATGDGSSFQSADVTISAFGALTADVTVMASPPNIRNVAQGFLVGLTDDSGTVLLPSFLPGINPKQWRLSRVAAARYALSQGWSTTFVMSDVWFSDMPKVAGTVDAPWMNWTTWETFVATLVTDAITDGWVPTYWDIWNEPGDGFLNAASLALQTKDAYNEMFRRAYNIVKTYAPTHKMVAPSPSSSLWSQPNGPLGSGSYPIDEFLAFSDANGLVWDAVAFHENEPNSDGDIFSLPSYVDRHLANMRAVVNQHPASVPSGRMHANEYMPKLWYRLPGHTVCYMRALEDPVANVAEANRAVWGNFDAGIGCLTAFGGFAPTWFVHHVYSQMDGLPRMAITSHPSPYFSGLACRDDGASVVRVLLGRHQTDSANEFKVPPTTPPSALTATITIAWPYGGSSVHAVVSIVPAQESPITGMTVASDSTVALVGGVATIVVPNVADGEAIWIVLG